MIDKLYTGIGYEDFLPYRTMIEREIAELRREFEERVKKPLLRRVFSWILGRRESRLPLYAAAFKFTPALALYAMIAIVAVDTLALTPETKLSLARELCERCEDDVRRIASVRAPVPIRALMDSLQAVALLYGFLFVTSGPEERRRLAERARGLTEWIRELVERCATRSRLAPPELPVISVFLSTLAPVMCEHGLVFDRNLLTLAYLLTRIPVEQLEGLLSVVPYNYAAVLVNTLACLVAILTGMKRYDEAAEGVRDMIRAVRFLMGLGRVSRLACMEIVHMVRLLSEKLDPEKARELIELARELREVSAWDPRLHKLEGLVMDCDMVLAELTLARRLGDRTRLSELTTVAKRLAEELRAVGLTGRAEELLNAVRRL